MRRGRLIAALVVLAVSASVITAAQLGYVERLRNRIWKRPPRLTAGDFPAGVSAPLDDLASLPSRPVVLGIIPRGSAAPVLWAAQGGGEAFYKKGFAIDVAVKVYEREEALREALMAGAENGGVDFAALSVSTLAMTSLPLRDAQPRTVLLLGRSRGQEALVARAGLRTPASLVGKRLGAEPRSTSWYFALWVLSRAGLSTKDVTLVPLPSAFEAGAALKSGSVDAVAGFAGDVVEAARPDGHVVATTADAPHLVATVLVVRGEFAARYPDAVRRVVRGALEANRLALKDPLPMARALGDAFPRLGDPTHALSVAPPATLKDNLAFFKLSGDAPVTYGELYDSAVSLSRKLGRTSEAPHAEDTADFGPLKYVSSAR